MSSNPYESPPLELEKIEPTKDAAAEGLFDSGHAVSLTARVLLALDAVLTALLLVYVVAVDSPLLSAATRQQLIDRYQLHVAACWIRDGVSICTAVVFLFWFHGVCRKLVLLGVSNLSFTPGQAVRTWFIPILNLSEPYFCTREIWRASDPNCANTDGREWKRAPISWLLPAWWAAWVIGIPFTLVTPRLPLDSVQDLLRHREPIIFIESTTVVSAILAILVVNSIDRRLEQKHEKRLRELQAVVGDATPA